MDNALLRAIQAGAVNPEDLRQLLASLGPGESLDPSELANVLGGPGTTRTDRADQPQRTMDSQQNALLRAVSAGDMGDQPSRYAAQTQAAPQNALLATMAQGDQPGRTMQRGPESPPPVPPALKDLPTDQLRDAYHPNQGGFVRNETSGKTLFLNGQPGGVSEEPYAQPQQGGGGSTMAELMAKFGNRGNQGAMPNPDLSGQGGPKIMPAGAGQGMMRVIGSGNGTTVDLGTEPDQQVSLDYSRGKIDVPGVGRAYYGKDGNAYVPNADGSKTKVLLGYDMQGSMALNKAAQERELGQAQIEHTQEQTRASRANNPDAATMGATAGLSGDALLKSMDPGTAGIVKQMVEGRMAPPTGMALRNPRVLQLMELAGQVEPGFDSTTWARRYATAQEFAKGKSYQSLNALNTVGGHLDTLDKAIDDLKNTNVLPGLLNPIENAIGQHVQGHTQQTNYATVLQTVVPELERAYRGAGGSEGSLQRWQAALSGNNGYDQQKSAVKEIAGLLQSKIDALGQSYSTGMNKSSEGYDLLSPKAAAVFKRLQGLGSTSSQTQAPSVQAPSVGEIRKGFMFRGGDPSSSSSWTKVS